MRRRRIKKTGIQAFLLAAVMLFSSVCGQYGGQVKAQVRDFAEDENVVVVLDPGHGAWNPGACNKKYGLKERELNLKVSKYTKQYLEQYEGVEVYLTRESNSEDHSLKKRAQIAADYNADLLVSQHFDGSTDKSQNGAHVIVSRSNYIKEYNAGCEQLGRLICKNLHAATGVKIRYPGSGGVRTRKTERGREYTFEDGTKSKADYYGIIQSSIRLGFPAIIIEHATLTNNKDAKMIKKESTLKALAKADALAIAQYFHLEKRKSGGGDVSLTYRCSMEDIGWQGYKGSGETAGTMQFKKQMEALCVSLENEATETAISGLAYIGDGVGWKEAGAGSDITLGAHKSGHGIEAFMLSIANCPEKQLQYRAYVRDTGWTRWTAQGEVCGAPGSAKPIEAVQLRFTDSAAAGFAGNQENTFIYKTHGEKEKWSAWAKSGTSLKVAGKSDYIDSVQLALMNATEGAAISARGYYNGKWQAQSIGTDMKLGRPGGTYPLEAVQISLLNVPDMVLEYRVYIKSLGWTDWCSQSDVAGIPGHGYSLTKIQLRMANAQTAAHAKPSVSYRLKDSKGYGDWMERTKSVKAAGGQKAEKLEVVLLNYPQGAKLKAKAYVEGSGWKEYSSKKCSLVIGTNKKKLQAFRLSLEGTEAYALQYKAYIKGKGWTDWTDQGAYVGTGGKKSKTYITKVMIRVVPVEQPPTTEAPDTEAPATEAPATEAPATEAPATEAPATEAPATETPATEASTTETPATQDLTTEIPAAKTPEPEVPEAPDAE